MKTPKLKFSLALCLGLMLIFPLVGGCQKNDLSDDLPNEIKTVEDAYRAIIGEWEWEKTIVMLRGQGTTTQTPLSESETRQFIFRSDRTATLLENGNANVDYDYSIATSAQLTGTQYGQEDLVLLLATEERSQMPSLSLRSKSLIISDRLGTSHYYIRK